MKKKLGTVMMVVALMVILGLAPAAYAASPTTVLLDSVNIGDTTSEAGHSLLGWSNIWSGCGWCSREEKICL